MKQPTEYRQVTITIPTRDAAVALMAAIAPVSPHSAREYALREFGYKLDDAAETGRALHDTFETLSEAAFPHGCPR